MTVRKVLCVDDSAAELSLNKQIVSKANLNVVSAANGRDAILRVESIFGLTGKAKGEHNENMQSAAG